MKAFLRLLALSAAVGTLLAPAGGTRAQLGFPLPGHPASMRGSTP